MANFEKHQEHGEEDGGCLHGAQGSIIPAAPQEYASPTQNDSAGTPYPHNSQLKIGIVPTALPTMRGS